MIVSSDADGVVKVWDVRMVAELGTIDAGQHPINKVGKYEYFVEVYVLQCTPTIPTSLLTPTSLPIKSSSNPYLSPPQITPTSLLTPTSPYLLPLPHSH